MASVDPANVPAGELSGDEGSVDNVNRDENGSGATAVAPSATRRSADRDENPTLRRGRSSDARLESEPGRSSGARGSGEPERSSGRLFAEANLGERERVNTRETVTTERSQTNEMMQLTYNLIQTLVENKRDDESGRYKIRN